MERSLELLRHHFRMFMGCNTSQHSGPIRQLHASSYQALDIDGVHAHRTRAGNRMGNKRVVRSS